MLATFLIEISFALYILWRYKLNNISRLVVAILASLATFQAAEYMVCGGVGMQPGMWSRLGYSAITLLPPLGIHLSLAIAGKKQAYLLGAAYATAAAFIAYFVFITHAITGQTCYANYAVFEGGTAFSGLLYLAYYYGWLAAGVFISLKNAIGKVATPLRWLAAGYMSFIIPTTLANIIEPSTIAGIPSIMCGFAVLLAFILTLRVTPETIPKADNNRLLPKIVRR